MTITPSPTEARTLGVLLLVLFFLGGSPTYTQEQEAPDSELSEEEENPKLGSIAVASTPPGASAYIEGFYAGTTPVTVSDLRPDRTYRVYIASQEAGEYFADVEVEQSQVAEVNGRLSGVVQMGLQGERAFGIFDDAAVKRLKKARSGKPLREYDALELTNFLVRSEEVPPPAHLYILFPDLARRLGKATKFDRLFTLFTAANEDRGWRAAGAPTNSLVLTGALVRYQGGSRAMRYLAGPWGGGATRMDFVYRLAEKETGETVLEGYVTAKMRMGLFGGESSKVSELVAKAVANQIKKNW